jgi:hypothetical protein
MKLKGILFGASFAIAAALGTAASASSCIGNCGVLGANGVVVAPPGGGTYGYVTTSGGVSGAGQISGVGGINGSEFTTSLFSAAASDNLQFNFNFVTSDGGEFADYAFAELLDGSLSHVAWLFTARTQPSGDTSPGAGLPTNDSTLTPSTSAIIGDGPSWSPLGGSSGSCYAAGCGYTGWIQSDYTVLSAGTYALRFGVTNWTDDLYDTGLAYAGANIGGTVIDTGGGVPEPTTWALMIMGFGLAGTMLRRRNALAA